MARSGWAGEDDAARWCWLAALGGGNGSGCVVIEAPEVEVVDVDGVSVFAFVTEPAYGMDALTSGLVATPGGCLAVDGSVVVWRPSQLDAARAALARLQDGGAPGLRLGGGQVGTTDDLPDGMGAGCAGRPVWFAGDLVEPMGDVGALSSNHGGRRAVAAADRWRRSRRGRSGGRGEIWGAWVSRRARGVRKGRGRSAWRRSTASGRAPRTMPRGWT